jgi:hypothetical protein
MRERITLFLLFMVAVWTAAAITLLFTDNSIFLAVEAGGITAIFGACVRAFYLHRKRHGKRR